MASDLTRGHMTCRPRAEALSGREVVNELLKFGVILWCSSGVRRNQPTGAEPGPETDIRYGLSVHSQARLRIVRVSIFLA